MKTNLSLTPRKSLLVPFFGKHCRLALLGCLLVLPVSGILTANAANISMTGSDGFGATSFNAGLNWAGGAAPSAANNYFTGGFLLRTPTASGNFTFAGNSLTIQPNSTANSTAMN